MSASEPITKAAFAERRGVSRAAVTGYIADGKIDGEALVVQDGREMILPDVAERQLSERLHQGQRLGASLSGTVAVTQVQQQSGDQLRYQRAAADIKETAALRAKMEILERNGDWCRTAEVKAAWSRRLAELLNLIEAGFPDFADAVLKAAREGDRRAVILALRGCFRELRQRVAEQMGAQAEALPEAAAPAEAERT